MQALTLHPNAPKVRSALLEILDWGIDPESAQVVLGALFPNADSDALKRTWARLESHIEDVHSLRDRVVPPGFFDDLGGGQFRDMDAESALEAAESSLDEALTGALTLLGFPEER